MESVHRTQVRVRYGETDKMGLVYHANYIVYFELGRTELMRSRGVDYAEMERHGMSLAVIDVGVKYRRPARYDDLLTVETRLTEASGARVRFEYRVLLGDELLTEGFTRLGCVDDDGRPTRIQSPWRERIRDMVATG